MPNYLRGQVSYRYLSWDCYTECINNIYKTLKYENDDQKWQNNQKALKKIFNRSVNILKNTFTALLVINER